MGLSKKKVVETKKPSKHKKPQISIPILRSCGKELYTVYPEEISQDPGPTFQARCSVA
jgi:hypothetical protein